MLLMHDWWSAFVLIANRAGRRMSGRGCTLKYLWPYSYGTSWKSSTIGTYISVVKVKRLHMPGDTLTVSPPWGRAAHCKVTLEQLMGTNMPIEGNQGHNTPYHFTDERDPS